VVGKLPFFAEYEGDLYRKIQNAKYKFPEDEDAESAVPQGAKNLIKRIFNKDASKRITAAQILEDPWLKDQVGEDNTEPTKDESAAKTLHEDASKEEVAPPK